MEIAYDFLNIYFVFICFATFYWEVKNESTTYPPCSPPSQTVVKERITKTYANSVAKENITKHIQTVAKERITKIYANSCQGKNNKNICEQLPRKE